MYIMETVFATAFSSSRKEAISLEHYEELLEYLLYNWDCKTFDIKLLNLTFEESSDNCVY